MPVSTGAACLINEDCPITPMPTKSANCGLDFAYGGINDLYFIPCTQTMSETNILDTAWWTALLGDAEADPVVPNVLGAIGIGLGSITKKSDRRERVGSCRGEQIVSTTWALTYVIKAMDKSSADTTKAQVNAILQRYQNFQVIARMCDGADSVLPIGVFSTSDVNWTVPDNSEEMQTIQFELSWIEFAIPKVYTVTGLSAVIPKA